MSQPAARVGDSTLHGPPLLGAGAVKVLIGGKPAWRVGDVHTCPLLNAPPPVGPGTPHATGTTMPPGAFTVLIEGKPAARMGDIVLEPGAVIPLPPPNPILSGCFTVLIGPGSFPFPIVINPDGTMRVGNHIVIEGDEEFQAKTLADLNTIANTPSSDPNRNPAGITTLNSIDNGSHDVTIKEGKVDFANNTVVYNCSREPGADVPGVGAPSTVRYDPDFEPPTAADPNKRMTSDVGLHHELTHADHNQQGINAHASPPVSDPINPHLEEENTIAWDNLYRDDRGIPRRANHSVL